MNAQLSKLNFASKNKTRTTVRITKKHFQNEEMPQELFLTARQKTIMRNSFAKNMSTDIKPSKVQLSKTTH